MSDSKEPQAIPRGPERELQIYALGLSGARSEWARSGDVRQRDSTRGGCFQGSRAGGTSRAGGPSLPVGVAGQEGVREVLLNLLADLDLTMALSGYACCHELEAAALCKSDSSELLRQPQL